LASTATNKQPLLIDRPLLQYVSLGEASALTSSTNFNTPIAAGLKLLVDPGSDGACIDSVSVLMTEASTLAVKVILFISEAPQPSGVYASNTAVVSVCSTTTGLIAGDRVNFPMLPLSTPVPGISSAATSVASEFDKKNTGLFLPPSRYLYAGLNLAITAPSTLTRIHVVAQGGYY